MRIAADAMGGDHGCQVVIDGLLQALEQLSQIEYILVVGDKSQLGKALGGGQVGFPNRDHSRS